MKLYGSVLTQAVLIARSLFNLSVCVEWCFFTLDPALWTIKEKEGKRKKIAWPSTEKSWSACLILIMAPTY